MVTRLEPGEGVRSTRIVAIVRDRTGVHLRAACDTLLEAGVSVLEVTTNTPGAAGVVADLIAAGATEVGMGTVRTVEHVRLAADAGASFIVTPTVSLPVGLAAAEAGLRWYPGAATPTEIETAWTAGATAVKVFPAGVLGGVRFIREVRAPLDDIPLIPTGGVRIDDIADYLATGALAVGMGSPLLGDAVASGDLGGLRVRAEAALAAVREATA
ncbi:MULTISPECIES: bifunctional 4-hydroxy-2-oxoglutarate aldolase/2-dehydro-3-deoxy-phosphogluconate aldolase [unclassified Microbacterium]|uniref:bifunctional 4-hydroxy-2-oxoglutarate aldolase/2-dehydro-3-deoxy-phosphogluconate aldolase n=1 Tax=unclassified Microbacterium TaxID=2609290 RepID=UPI000CFD5A15|nr:MULTISPECIES: bifunctional 4-hydroxy-2-oxoglutarate aldolase/2-dehydro-3-deoxy-phosphogluconate aldolase [unclassified Microbacterium]PQZ60223.1 2-dehydro-3-deoxyphosphogluconate aldolase [Microbacterium sp. MYb43]PQZ76874.1 2-dehydro-3-deoxyphosphogluconate aldolase [Microbacterium sp. MYb40]PRB23266.1 2-dehydro-3-deoxyphosphogluconate aldolase [Microbacterium sp. MYb54]PRB28170.1 2-dehydro-3-deoxyphosphogluconate aldolase [Microbacterium sp. MYb50]PRB66221.1 2-dehydro-3-deoxyphosphoglucon